MYIKRHLEEAVRKIEKMFGAVIVTGPRQVGDEVKFINFMTSIAGCTGQLLNLASVSRDAGVSQPTIDRWMSILRASNIVYLL